MAFRVCYSPANYVVVSAGSGNVYGKYCARDNLQDSKLVILHPEGTGFQSQHRDSNDDHHAFVGDTTGQAMGYPSLFTG